MRHDQRHAVKTRVVAPAPGIVPNDHLVRSSMRSVPMGRSKAGRSVSLGQEPARRGFTMPRGRYGPRQGSGNVPRKRDKQDVQMRQEILCTAVQGMLRVILDAILWWIDRGGRL